MAGKAALYDEYARRPFGWLARATYFKHASDVLWSRIEANLKDIPSQGARLIGAPKSEVDAYLEAHRLESGLSLPMFQLLGTALECLLKGLLLIRDPTLVSSGNSARLRGHNLVKLQERAGEEVNDAEKSVLTDLSREVEWSARYPVPMRSEQWDSAGIELFSLHLSASAMFDRWMVVATSEADTLGPGNATYLKPRDPTLPAVTMVDLGDEDRAVLAHVLMDPDAWVAHALTFENGEQAVRDKIERYRPDYRTATERHGNTYKTRAQRELAGKA
jgi:hypothetical protein